MRYQFSSISGTAWINGQGQVAFVRIWGNLGWFLNKAVTASLGRKRTTTRENMLSRGLIDRRSEIARLEIVILIWGVLPGDRWGPSLALCCSGLDLCARLPRRGETSRQSQSVMNRGTEKRGHNSPSHFLPCPTPRCKMAPCLLGH